LSRSARQIIAFIVSLSLSAPSFTAATAEVFGNATISRSDYEACQTQDEPAFRAAIERITIAALQDGLKNVDYEAALTARWREAGMDHLIDTRVDIAVAEVKDNTSWGTLIKSLAYKEQAQKLAREVAERVYRSKVITSAIEDLAMGVGKEVGKQIELATRDAAGPAVTCLKAFLGSRYGETLAEVVSMDARKDFQMSTEKGGAKVSSQSVLRESSAGLTGVAILLVRRQLANLARSIGQRLVGAVLARLVSVVAGGVGVVLIAKDLWDLRHGVLPIIANEMKSPETKKKVREELAKGLEQQIASHVREIGSQSADRVVTIWHQFRSAHAKTLGLALRNDKYKQFVNETDPKKLGRLDEITSLVLEREGDQGIKTRLDDGTLYEAVTQLPDAALTIARETRSLEEAIRWNALAQADIDKITDYGIYRTAKPANFTRASLKRVLALNDRIAVTRLASIDSEALETLLSLDQSSLKKLARGLTADELDTLSGYLNGLSPRPRQMVLEQVASSPGKMQLLASQRVRAAVLASQDQEAAVNMMLKADGTFDAKATLKNFQLALNGKISPILIVDKHPIALVAIALIFVLFLLMLRRLFSLRPQKKGT